MVDVLVRVLEVWHQQLKTTPTSSMQIDRHPLAHGDGSFGLQGAQGQIGQGSGHTSPEASQLRQQLVNRRLLTEDGKQWHKLQRSPDQEKLVPVETDLTTTGQGWNDHNPLEVGYRAQASGGKRVVPEPAPVVWNWGHSLILLRMRPATMKRSGLAQQLSQSHQASKD